jgi:hypothetical protein
MRRHSGENDPFVIGSYLELKGSVLGFAAQFGRFSACDGYAKKFDD